MNKGGDIDLELISLVDGAKLLRLVHPASGLALEKKLDPSLPIIRQKDRLFSVFEVAVAQAQLTPA